MPRGHSPDGSCWGIWTAGIFTATVPIQIFKAVTFQSQAHFLWAYPLPRVNTWLVRINVEMVYQDGQAVFRLSFAALFVARWKGLHLMVIH